MLIKHFTSACWGLGFIVCLGCSDGVKVVPAQGTVTLDGKPLDKLMVEFWPESEGFRSFGETDADGKFVLTTDDGEQQGASVGTHRVIVKDVSVLGDKFLGRAGENVRMGTGQKPRISTKFATPETTSLTVVVEASGANNFDIAVTK